MRLWLAMLCASLLECGGCYTHVVHQKAADCGKGIRYYQSSPYLLVYSDAKNGLQWQILYLPDQTKKMMVRPTVYWGRSEMDLYFHNGILTGSSELSDTTQIPTAVIAAVQSALPLLGAAAFEAKANVFPAPYLYKIVVNGSDVTFVGSQGDHEIIVPKVKANSP
jgi:hypothetical protein